MIRCLSILGLLTAGVVLFAADDNKAADAKASAKVQVTALNIFKAPPPKPGVFMMRSNGMRMEVMVSLPKRFITGVDVKASKLDRFADDKDNVLYKKSSNLFGGGPNWLAEFGMRFDPDGESVAVQIQGTSPPGKGAAKIILKGSLNVKYGMDEKVADAKELTLKPKEEAGVGPFKVRVSQFGNLEVASSEENIKKVEFFDDKGKAISMAPPSRSHNPTAKEKYPHVYACFLFGKHEKLAVKIHYFTKVEAVNVPLDLRIGMGLE